MKLIQIAVVTFLLGATIYAHHSTQSQKGGTPLNTPNGVSLREESSRRRHNGGFFLFYGKAFPQYRSGGNLSSAGRTHRGGGISGGK